MKGSLDGVSRDTGKIVAFLEKRTPAEQQVVDMVERKGGAENVIEVFITFFWPKMYFNRIVGYF